MLLLVKIGLDKSFAVKIFLFYFLKCVMHVITPKKLLLNVFK